MPYFNPQTGRFELPNEPTFDPLRFADELVADADIDDAAKQALQTILAKPTVVNRLKNSVALRSTAQSTIDRARAAADEAERLRDANFAWAEQNRKPLEEFIASGGGRATTVVAPSGEALTKADVLALLKQQRDEFDTQLREKDEAYIGLQLDTYELATEYGKLFDGATLPLADLQQYAIAKRTSMRNAFQGFIAPKLEEKRTKDIEKIKADAFEAGRQEALSHAVDYPSGEPGGDLTTAFGDSLLGRRTTTLTNADGKALSSEDTFVANWNKTRGFTQDNGKTH